MQHVIEKAAGMIEALPFIQRFRGETVVVKFGGSMMDDPELCRGILQDIAFMEVIGMRPVVVHGGGKAISRALQAEGVESRFLQGLRVTDGASIRVVERVLNQEINPEMVRTLAEFQCKAHGIHGEDILCVQKHAEIDPATGEALDWGFVGEVTEVNVAPIRAFLQAEMVPVVTPLGRGADGNLYNINADEAAAAIACALQARKLVFLSDVPGLLRTPGDVASMISSVTVGEVHQLIRDGIIAGGMLPKIRGALKALETGVRKTHIIDSSLSHSLLLELFTNEGVGTEIVP